MKKNDPIIPVLREWAASKDFIIRLWVFGSYCRGASHKANDIDVVIQIGRTERFFGPSEAWYCRRNQWMEEIQPNLHHHLPLHLLPLGHTKATRVVRKYWKLLYVHPAHAQDAIPSQESFDAAERIATISNRI